MSYFVAGGFRTKKLSSRLSSSELQFYTENGCFAFLSPLLGRGAKKRAVKTLMRSAAPHEVSLTRALAMARRGPSVQQTP